MFDPKNEIFDPETGVFDQPTLHDYIKDHWGDLQDAMGEDDLLRLVVR